MLSRLICWWKNHDLMLPRTDSLGVTTMQCRRCLGRIPTVQNYGDDSSKRKVYEDRPDSRVVMFRPQPRS